MPDAGRGAGVDEVAGLEDQELAQVVDDEVGSKTIVEVEPVCRRTPLTSSHMPRASTSSISSGVTSHGPAGLNVSADLPLDHWPPRSIWNARSLTSLTTT